MRVASCMLVLAMLCTTVTGCSLFKKNTNGTAGPPNAGGPQPAQFPGAGDPLLNSTIPPPPAFPKAPATPPATTQASTNGQTLPVAASGSSILAGTVIDAYHRPMGNAYIRWVSLDEKDTGAPIDVAADGHGHFIIQGVKPGASYKLIARTKHGEKMLAGTVLTSAPNVRVVIPIREDFANAHTPPLPGTPAYQGGAKPPATTGGDPNPFGTAWNAGQAAKPGLKAPVGDPLSGIGGVQPAGEPNLPATMKVPAPPPANPTFPPGLADTLNDRERLPLLKIPGKGNKPNMPIDPPRPPGLAPGDSRLDTGPTRVPMCVLAGKKLEALALRDTKGQVWEYRKQGAGKLVLMEFWGTHCIYCREMMPTLNRLNTQYGSRGLEVLGIALEPGKDERRDAEQVAKVCTSMQVSYRQLLGHVGSFNVGKDFNIEGLPTLILLDETGTIIWHHVGRPDPALLSALERTIQSRLNNRPF